MSSRESLIDQKTINDGVTGLFKGNASRSAVLTTGEYVEFILDLRADDVLIADASSDSFDPSLEVLDASGKVLLANDDRFEGEQSPLVLFRSLAAGKYSVRVRSFANKGAGKLAYRQIVLPSTELRPGTQGLASGVLGRVPMKAGQLFCIRDLSKPYDPPKKISPIGIPILGLQLWSDSAYGFVHAPVDGDYYFDFGQGLEAPKIQVVEVTPSPQVSGRGTPVEGVAAWELNLSSDSFTEIEAVGATQYGVHLAEKPKTYALSEIRMAFGPQPRTEPSWSLARRAPDSRWEVVHAREKVTLWALWSRPERTTLRASAYGTPWPADIPVKGKNVLGRFDLYSFPTRVGDVIRVTVDSPDSIVDVNLMSRPWQSQELVHRLWDQPTASEAFVSTSDGMMTATVAPRSLMSSSSYSLRRQIISPTTLQVGKKESRDLKAGEIHVWRVQLRKGKPFVLRFVNENSGYPDFYFSNGESFIPNLTGGYQVFAPDVDRDILIVLSNGQGRRYELGITPLE